MAWLNDTPSYEVPTSSSPGCRSASARACRTRSSWPSVYWAMARGQRNVHTRAGAAATPSTRWSSRRASAVTSSSCNSTACGSRKPPTKARSSTMPSGARPANSEDSHTTPSVLICSPRVTR